MLNSISKFLGRCFWVLVSLFITLVIVFGIVYTYLELQLPDVKVLNDIHMQVPLRIYTNDGKLLAQYGSIRRRPVKLKNIPPLLVKAVLATEDARYYDHPGVDLISILRAAHAVIRSGRKVQGASTITMQVARNFFLTRKKTYGRKIKEILLALKIDKELSKDKVLELYLNKVYFGKQAYGVAAAAKVYYGKPLNALNLAQMAMIAGLPQAPSRNNPLINPKQALKRRNHVLWRMKQVGFIKKPAYEDAITHPITATFHGRTVATKAPFFAEMVRQVMVANYGEKAYDNGYTVYTTLSSQLQAAGTNSLRKGLIAYSKRHGYIKPQQNFGTPSEALLPKWQKQLQHYPNSDPLIPAVVVQEDTQSIDVLMKDGEVAHIDWPGLSWAWTRTSIGYIGTPPKNAFQIVKPGDVVWVQKDRKSEWILSQLPKVQGALIAMDPKDGAILALDGGFDYSFSNFNRATQAKRQPGSNFKPFIYAAALDKGFTLASIINDAPIVLEDSGENRLWRPHNDTHKFYGPTRIKVGLAKSRNLVSIRLLQDIGVDYALQYIKRFGFDTNDMPHTLSLALGAASMTPLQVASGYAVFANGGYRVSPYFIQKIIDENGKTVYVANPQVACEDCITQKDPHNKPLNMAPQAISAQTAYLMTDALQSVIQEGTASSAKILKRNDLAGKTGTTNNQVDAWFTGFNTKLLTTVWVGYDNLDSLHEYGASAALPIWIDFNRIALQGVPESVMPEPAGIVTARIDKTTGLLAPPNDTSTLFEHFKADSAPKQYAQSTQLAAQHAAPSTQGSTTTTTTDDQPIF